MEIVFKAVIAISTMPVAFGFAALPASLAKAPDYFGRGATIALFLGCVISLAGLLRRDRVRGMAVQLVGLTGVGAGAGFYAVALAVGGSDLTQSRIAVGMSLGIGLGAAARYWQVSRYLKALQRVGM